MKRSMVLGAAFGVLMLPLLVASPSRAEWFADLYAGPAFTEDHNVGIDSPRVGVSIDVMDVKFDTTGLVGGRAGYWFGVFDFLHLGVVRE